MKQIFALILCLALFLQLAACGTPTATESTNPETTTAQQPPSETKPDLSEKSEAVAEKSETVTEPLVTMPENITDIQDFEDFKDMMEKQFDTSETIDEEGNTLIEIRPSEDKDHNSVITNPVVPGVDTIVRPTEPKPTEPKPTEPKPTEPKPTEPAPTEPKPTEPAPTEPKPTEPKPTEPKPTEPKPTEPKPTEPAPTEPKPTEPAPTEPKPTEPAPTEPKPTEPAPTEPKPTEPVPTEPKPTEPKPTEPKPTEPEYSYTTGQHHTALHYSQRYLYSILSEEEQIWYQKIDVAVRNLEDRVDLGADMTSNNNYHIYYLYMMDNPEHFYLINKVGCYSNSAGEDGLILGYSDGTHYCGMGYGNATDALRSGIRAKQTVFNRELQRIISTIPANAPAVVKEKLIYDRILIDSSYNLNARWDGLAEDNWTAYGILVNKTGVCESYAEAFQILCLSVGIKCTGIVGTVSGGGHKWNAVQLDGQWYACDITFDDPVGGGSYAVLYHDYFNLTSAEMEQRSHVVSNYMYPTPTCYGTKYSYENYFGN